MVKIRIGAVTDIGLIPDSAEPPHAIVAREYYVQVEQALQEEAAGKFKETDEERFARLKREFGMED